MAGSFFLRLHKLLRKKKEPKKKQLLFVLLFVCRLPHLSIMIELKDAIKILESGQWCSLRFITADVAKGSGGKVLEFPKCRIARRYINQHSTDTHQQHQISLTYKEANHALNFTRNVELPNKSIRKVHPILITHINNQAVI